MKPKIKPSNTSGIDENNAAPKSRIIRRSAHKNPYANASGPKYPIRKFWNISPRTTRIYTQDKLGTGTDVCGIEDRTFEKASTRRPKANICTSEPMSTSPATKPPINSDRAFHM